MVSRREEEDRQIKRMLNAAREAKKPTTMSMVDAFEKILNVLTEKFPPGRNPEFDTPKNHGINLNDKGKLEFSIWIKDSSWKFWLTEDSDILDTDSTIETIRRLVDEKLAAADTLPPQRHCIENENSSEKPIHPDHHQPEDQ